MSERDDKLDQAIEFAVGLMSKAYGHRVRCATCNKTAYEHIDHAHHPTPGRCNFGDCGKFEEPTDDTSTTDTE